jgi:DNA-binding MarR family transcriptional regulator
MTLEDTLLGLFTEIAIVEHLARTRVERDVLADLTSNQFGILNYFVRTHPSPDTVAGIAWAFQQEEDYTLGNAQLLASRGYVSLTQGVTDRDTVVTLTEDGRRAQAEHVERIGPEIRQMVSEIPSDELQTAYRVLHDIRLVLDNLPDR